MLNSPTIIEDKQKYTSFKSERKRATSAKVQSGYINFLYPTTADKVKALAYSSCFDDDEDSRYAILGEIEDVYSFDPWGVVIYLQSVATDLNEMVLRSFRNLIDALKPKKKFKQDVKFAEAIDKSEYEFNVTQSQDFKKHPKGKRYKQYDMSYSKDKKGQSDFVKEMNARVYASERGKPVLSETAKAEKTRTSFLNMAAASSMAGEGGCASYSWDDSCGGHFAPCGPSIDYGFSMDW